MMQTRPWSSKQQLNREDLVYLQKDLLLLSMKLENKSSKPSGIMTSSNSMILDFIMRNILANTIINLVNE